MEVEIDRRNLFFLESLAKLYQELIQGEASGLSRLPGRPGDAARDHRATGAVHRQGDVSRRSSTSSRCRWACRPTLPLVVDMSLAQPFYDVFNAVDDWQRRSDRNLDELPGIIAKIPELEDIDVEGRSVLGPYRNYRSTLKEFVPENEEGLEDTAASGRPDRPGIPHGPDERSCPALRRLAADPRHGQCPQGGPQRRPDQQRLHAGPTPPTRSPS